MTQLFLQLAQSVTGNVVTIVALELGAAIIGYIIAWYYARSVYTPVIKGLEDDKTSLNNQITKLTGEVGSLTRQVSDLDEKIKKLTEDLASKAEKIKEFAAETGPVGKYVISKAKSGENYFNLKATNGQIILTSVMFPTMDDCSGGILTTRGICADDNMFERKISSNNKHFFNLKSPEGNIVGKSEIYESQANMEKGIASVKRNGLSTNVVEE
jgi:uncharacterized protein